MFTGQYGEGREFLSFSAVHMCYSVAGQPGNLSDFVMGFGLLELTYTMKATAVR